MTDQDLTFTAPAQAGTVAEAAMAAADAGNDNDEQAQAIIDAWEAALNRQTKNYVREAMKLHKEGPATEIAGPMGPVWPRYPYWNLWLGGPWQTLGGAGGPFMPHKVVRFGDPTFIGYALWRNPACINWACPAPSACQLMSGWNAQIWLRTFNFTLGNAGPSYGPFNIVLGAFPNCLTIQYQWIHNALPQPLQGEPHLYEVSATVDITGPGAVPFAGYTTWHFDPDWDPFPPMLTTAPHWQFEIPARFVVYVE